MEIEESQQLSKEVVERESDRQLEIIRKFYNAREDILADLVDSARVHNILRVSQIAIYFL